MNKVLLIIHREFLTRVRKPSFWLLAFLVPVVIGILYYVPVKMASCPPRHTRVLVVDETGLFHAAFRSSDYIEYGYAGSLDYARAQLDSCDMVSAVLFIPARETTIPNDAFLYYLSDAPSLDIQSDINHQLQTILRNAILLDVHGISADDYHQLTHTSVKLHLKDIATGRAAFLQVKQVLAIVLALLVFFMVFFLGSQVFRGVLEEKNNRIVEVLLGSVRPYYLMLGKIIGIGLSALLQFCVWVVFSLCAICAIRAANADLFARVEALHVHHIATKGAEATLQYQASLQATPVSELLQGIDAVNFPVIVVVFVLFLVLGYSLYAAFFASAGALSDSDTDAQQFALPLTAPLLVALLCLPAILYHPSGTLSVWLSIIPFTSPVAMLARLPFGVPFWQMGLALGILLLSIPLFASLSARLYRMSILYNDVRVSFKLFVRWIFCRHR